MSRGPVVVRDASTFDAEALQQIWLDFVGHTSDPPEGRLDEIRRSINRLITEPSERLLVAVVDADPVGVAHLRRAPLSPLHEDDAVHVSYLHVLSGFRRRGIGTQLLHAAADWADEKDSRHIVASAAATARDANRFLARLGLGQVAIVRASTVAAMRAKLACVGVASADPKVLVARRLRRRTGKARA